jgi:hypothetical protein
MSWGGILEEQQLAREYLVTQGLVNLIDRH